MPLLLLLCIFLVMMAMLRLLLCFDFLPHYVGLIIHWRYSMPVLANNRGAFLFLACCTYGYISYA